MTLVAWRASALALAVAVVANVATAAASREAVPFYSPEHYVQGVYRGWMLPRATEFESAAQALTMAVGAFCAGAPADVTLRDGARARWTASLIAWTRLSAVAVGPLIKRKSIRVIDFAPARPQAIERAIAASPSGATAMESVGGPAKGFAALEWLLWTKPAQPGTPACRYTTELAADIQREATALVAEFNDLAQKEPGPETIAEAMSEIVNQWIGGVERLRWAAMEKPLRAAAGASAEYPRGAAGATAAQWRAQWNALEALALNAGATPPPGAQLVPLAAYLRGIGRNDDADSVAASVRAVDARMLKVDPRSATSVTATARALTALKRNFEARIAPALKIRVGFSDADGD